MHPGRAPQRSSSQPAASGSRSRARPPCGPRSSSSRPRSTASTSTRSYRALVGGGRHPAGAARRSLTRREPCTTRLHRGRASRPSRSATVDRIELLLVRLPFVAPFAITTAVWTAKEALLLRLEGERRHRLGRVRGRPRPVLRLRDDGDRPAHHQGLPAAARRDRDHARRARAGASATSAATEMAKATVENALIDLDRQAHEAARSTSSSAAPRKRILSGISIGIQEIAGRPARRGRGGGRRPATTGSR